MGIQKEYKELILSNTISIHDITDEGISIFRWLSDSINQGKYPLKINTVDFIIAKILNRQKQLYRFRRKYSFDVYVFGTFRKTFNPTYRVAEAFADFYLEMKILPNIISIPKHIFMKTPKIFINKIRNGVILYERR